MEVNPPAASLPKRTETRDACDGKNTPVDTVCRWYLVQGPECGGPCLFPLDRCCRHLEMQSAMGLGEPVIQGAPCQSFPIAAASILRNQVRAHAVWLIHLDSLDSPLCHSRSLTPCTTMESCTHGMREVT
jgi:hypothetical protein